MKPKKKDLSTRKPRWNKKCECCGRALRKSVTMGCQKFCINCSVNNVRRRDENLNLKSSLQYARDRYEVYLLRNKKLTEQVKELRRKLHETETEETSELQSTDSERPTDTHHSTQ
jgi:hypothetical protein